MGQELISWFPGPIKILAGLVAEMDKLTLKFKGKFKASQMIQNNFEKQEQS